MLIVLPLEGLFFFAFIYWLPRKRVSVFLQSVVRKFKNLREIGVIRRIDSDQAGY